MSPRKIVQIATAAVSNWHSLYALCDDGTVWDYQWMAAALGDNRKHFWKEMASIERHEPFTEPKEIPDDDLPF